MTSVEGGGWWVVGGGWWWVEGWPLGAHFIFSLAFLTASRHLVSMAWRFSHLHALITALNAVEGGALRRAMTWRIAYSFCFWSSRRASALSLALAAALAAAAASLTSSLPWSLAPLMAATCS